MRRGRALTGLETHCLQVAYRGHNHPVWSVAWSPFGHYFASGSHDSTARIWSTDRISPLRILSGHLSDVDAVTWHPNCNYIATGSSDSTARLWDVRKGECVRVFGTHPGTLHALAFSPNGRYLAMSGHTRDIHVWDIAEGKQVRENFPEDCVLVLPPSTHVCFAATFFTMPGSRFTSCQFY